MSKRLVMSRADNVSGHTEYQILAFTGGPILTDEQRERRKVISSTVVR